MEVTVGYADSNDIVRSEILRFTGEETDRYERRDTTFTLYKSPGGYRVHVEDSASGVAALHPHEWNPYTEELNYGLYSAEEVAEKWPAFGETVGVLRVRDID